MVVFLYIVTVHGDACSLIKPAQADCNFMSFCMKRSLFVIIHKVLQYLGKYRFWYELVLIIVINIFNRKHFNTVFAYAGNSFVICLFLLYLLFIIFYQWVFSYSIGS